MAEQKTEGAPRTWFVTGVSKGLGAALAKQIVGAGDQVIGLVRTPADAGTLEQLDRSGEGRARAVIGDVTDEARVLEIVGALDAEGLQIDVAVNNAGYGLIGATEEISSDELRAQFDVNFFGAFNVIKAVIPQMRQRRAGRVINITSISGCAPWAGTSAYTASKFALEGLCQTLHDEVKGLGVHVTNVAPGALRTAFGTSSLNTSKVLIEDYAETAHSPREAYKATGGKEAGDPVKAADAILEISRLPDPPMHLFLGADALKYLSLEQQRLSREVEQYKDLSLSIAFPETDSAPSDQTKSVAS